MNTKELIDFICAKHYRTTCSDENIANGFSFEEDGETINPRYSYGCKRCALLEIESGKVKKTEENKGIINRELCF